MLGSFSSLRVHKGVPIPVFTAIREVYRRWPRVRTGLTVATWNRAFGRTERGTMLLLIILLILLFGGGGGYYGYSRWGTGGGLGILGTVLLIVLVVYLLGGIH